MYYEINRVLKGKYEGSKIRDGEIDYNYKEYKLSPENITSYTIIDKSPSPYSSGGGTVKMYYLIEIVWKDGDKSLIYIDTDNYLTFIIAGY